MTLIPLDEWNRKRIQTPKNHEPNGIACPKCGKELCDDAQSLLCSNPPQLRVMCPACGYRSTRLV